MNLFARILSHGFALVVVALLAIGLIYRGELFSEYDLPDFLSLGHKPGESAAGREVASGEAAISVPAQPAGSDVTADEPAAPEPEFMPSASIDRSTTESPPAEPAADTPVGDAGAAGQAVTEMIDETAVDGAATVQQATQAPVPPVAEPQEISPQPAVDESGFVAPEPAVRAAIDTAAPEPAVAAPAAAPLPGDAGSASAFEPDVPATPVQARKTPAVTPYRVLAAAREAYWLRDYAAAEQKYQELIALEPGNPDGYGELGNMYFSQGDWDKASASYFEAGTRLAAQGMYDRARQLVEVIRGLNGGQAGDLEQQINAAESATP
ncbi:MAG TPA: tetratricopeptide repeat protein [Gammaproteobacteria bacterium]|nr:tetratricopeptide repeat protein [Gammaproteobacteria bacterium]